MQFRHLEAMAKWFKELVGQLKPRRPQDRPQMGVRWCQKCQHIQHHRVVPKWTLMNVDEHCFDAIKFIQIQWLQHVLWAQPVLNFNSDSNMSNSFSSARSSPSRLVRGQRSKTGSGPSATFLPRISLTFMVVSGGLIGALNDFNIFQYLQNDSTEGLRM